MVKSCRSLCMSCVDSEQVWIVCYSVHTSYGIFSDLRAQNWFDFPIYIMTSEVYVHRWHCCLWPFSHGFLVKVKPEGGFDAKWTTGNMFVHCISCLIQYLSTFWWFTLGGLANYKLERALYPLPGECRRTALQCTPLPLQTLICDQTEAYKVRESISNEEAHLKSYKCDKI